MVKKTCVGLIGVGLLGTAIAKRLLQNETRVIGFDTDPARRERLAALGGTSLSDAAEVFTQCDVVLLSLPTSQVVRKLVADNVQSISANSTIVDTTTGSPEDVIETGRFLAKQRVHYMEATIAGSSKQVRSGAGAMFIGGEKAVVLQCESLLSSILEKHFYVGPVGSASRFKLVHNLLLGLHRAVLAEGLVFAEALGFDPATALEILQQTPAASGVMPTKGPKMLERNYAAQARLSQHLKDVRLILEESRRVGTRAPLSELHQSLLEQAEQLGFGSADNCAVIEVFRHRDAGDEHSC